MIIHKESTPMMWKKLRLPSRSGGPSILMLAFLLTACSSDGFERPDRDEWFNISSRLKDHRQELSDTFLLDTPRATQRFYRHRALVSMQQQNILEPSAGHFDDFWIYELDIEGIRFHVSSLSPRLISSWEHLQDSAVSAVRVNDDGSGLTFFSKDPRTGYGYVAMIPQTEAKGGKTFRFPILEGNRLYDRRLKIVKSEKRPALPQPLARFQSSGVLSN